MLGALRAEQKRGGMLGRGGPNGRVEGSRNDLYLDTSAATLWIKEFEGRKVGWKCLGRLVADDTPGNMNGI